jgi:hypothetical protein
MYQLQYRNGIVVVNGAHKSYYTLKANVLYSGVTNRMALALDNYLLEVS